MLKLTLLFTERIHQAQAAAAKARKALQQKPKPPSKVVSDLLRACSLVVLGVLAIRPSLSSVHLEP